MAERTLLRRRQVERETPDERAKELLRMVLTQEERLHFIRHGNIVITGSDGGRYEVGVHGCSGNIRPLQNVKVGRKNYIWSRTAGPHNLLCAHPVMHTGRGPLPLADAIAAQVLTIKANERLFLETALVYL